MTVLFASAAAASAAPKTFVAEGNIAGPVGFITEPEWIVGCPDLPLTQGVDGYVVELPNRFSTADATAHVVGTNSTGIYDMDLHFYSADCERLAVADSTEVDEETSVYPTTRYILVEAYMGIDTNFRLEVTL